MRPGCGVLIIATEWSEYANADLQKLADVMRNRIIFDGRNILSPANIRPLDLSTITWAGPPLKKPDRCRE